LGRVVCFFSKGKEPPPKKTRKTPKPYRVSLSSPRGTPKGKKRGFLREDIPPPYSALEESKTTKSASEEEKRNPVYIMVITGSLVKPAMEGLFGILSALRKIQWKNTPRT
jgi:hypothetical protein